MKCGCTLTITGMPSPFWSGQRNKVFTYYSTRAEALSELQPGRENKTPIFILLPRAIKSHLYQHQKASCPTSQIANTALFWSKSAPVSPLWNRFHAPDGTSANWLVFPSNHNKCFDWIPSKSLNYGRMTVANSEAAAHPTAPSTPNQGACHKVFTSRALQSGSSTT